MSSLEHERLTPVRRSTLEPDPATDMSPQAHPLQALQRQLGNAQIARMLAQRADAPVPEEEDEEQLLQATHDPAVAQRADAPVPEEEDEEQLLQASPEVGLEGGPVSDTLADQIEAQRGGGSPLDGGTRDSMEQSFGTSFEDVRVHSGAESQQLNRSISAKAFTTGSDIFLGKDASANDGSLMAHELTHVVQQQSMDTSGPMTVGPAGDGYEQQADAAAAAVTAGGSAPAAQRKEDV